MRITILDVTLTPLSIGTAGLDYVTVARTITFAAGQTQVPIPVATIGNDVAELPEDFSTFLFNPSEGLAIGAQDTATVTIRDDESKQGIDFVAKTQSLIFFLCSCSLVLEVQFDPATYAVTEGGRASLLAVLNFAADYAVMVDFETRNGFAIGNTLG